MNGLDARQQEAPTWEMAVAGGARLSGDDLAGRAAGDDPAEEGLALFRRALEGRDPGAWEVLMGRYRGLVLDWVRRSVRAPVPREHEDDWVTRAFERFWLAVGPEGNRFRDLAAALRYLKLCVRSVVLDDVRARLSAPAESIDDLDEHRALSEGFGSTGVRGVEDAVIDRSATGDLWQLVLRELNGLAEQIVAYCAFVQGMKPGEIAARHPQHFTSVGDVYRTKRNALDRLRRSPQLLAHRDGLPAGAGLDPAPPEAPRVTVAA
jgi:hypothetical protein